MAITSLWRVFKTVRKGNAITYFSTAAVNGCLLNKSGKICIYGSSSGSKKGFMVDEPLDIVVNGLQPKKNVTLRATSMSGGRNNTLFQSFAHYEADANGCVRVKDHESKGGTYKGIEQMGLFWSMIPLKNDDVTIMRLMHKDIHSPVISKLELYDNFVDFGVETFSNASNLQESLSPIDCVNINRWYLAKHDVAVETVKTGRIRGEIFFPKNGLECQGVIDLFGSAGGLVSFRAALLASHGFTTYALPYFGRDTKDADDLDIEYFEEAIEWLLQYPNVKKDGGICIIATSFGVSPALLLATRTKNKVKATVCINGSNWVILHPISIDGKKVDALQADFTQTELSADGYLITRNIFLSEKQKSCQPASQIPIEKIPGKLLYLASGDDHNFNGVECANQMYRHLKSFERQEILETIVYPGAGHLLEPPYTSHCRHAFHKRYNVNLSFGGDAVSHAKAQEHAWAKIINFFKQA